MKKYIFGTTICAVMLGFLLSCSSAPKVTRVAASTQTNSEYFDDTDARIISESLIKSALSSPRLDAYIQEYTAKHKGALPAVIIIENEFRNATGEHIPIRIIFDTMRTAIIKSGKLEFVEGGRTRQAIREERQDQQENASEESVSALANERGANLTLTGVISSSEKPDGNTIVRAYFMKATMTNLETNRIIWEDGNDEIKKIIRRSKVKF